MNISIELMRPDEAGDVITLIRENYDKNVARYNSDDGNKIFYDYLNINDMIARNQHDHFTLIAKDSDTIAGMMEVRNNNHISLFFVRESMRGQGIGRRLFDKALDTIKANSETKEITVNSSPNSAMIYQELGFEKVSEERSFKGLRYVPMKAKV